MADHIVPPPDHITHPDHTTHPDHVVSPDHPPGEPDLHFYEPEPGEPRPHGDGIRPPDVAEPGLPSGGPADRVNNRPPVIEPRYDPDSVLTFLTDPATQPKPVLSPHGNDPVSEQLNSVIKNYENAWLREKAITVMHDPPDRLMSLNSYVNDAAKTYLTNETNVSFSDRLVEMETSLSTYETERWSAGEPPISPLWSAGTPPISPFRMAKFQKIAAETFAKLLKHADQIAREPQARGERRKIEPYLGKLLGVADKISKDIQNAAKNPAAGAIWKLDDRARDYFRRGGGIKDQVRKDATKYSGILQLFLSSIKTEAQTKLPKDLNKKLATELLKNDPTRALDQWHKLMKGADRKALIDHTYALVQTMNLYANQIKFLTEGDRRGYAAYTTLQCGLGAISEQMAQQLDERG